MELGRHIILLPAAMWVKQLHSSSLKRVCKAHQRWSDTLQEVHTAGVVDPRAIPKAVPRTKGVYHVDMDPLLVFQGWQMRPCVHLHTSNQSYLPLLLLQRCQVTTCMRLHAGGPSSFFSKHC